MAGVEKMSIAITHEMAEMVREAVQAGEYASASEVVREALRDWKAKQQARQLQFDEVRRLWQEGLDSGKPRDGAAVLAETRGRYKKKKSRGARK